MAKRNPVTLHIGTRKRSFDSHAEAYRAGLEQQNKGVHSEFMIVDSATGSHARYKRSGKLISRGAKNPRRCRVGKRNPTIHQALATKLGRTPTNAELKAEVARIKKEGSEIGMLRKSKKRNPEAAARSMREAFVGAPSKQTINVTEEMHVHEHLAALGELVQLKVKTLKGETFTIDFGKAENPKGVGQKVQGWIGRRAKAVAGVVGGLQKTWINPKTINPNGAPILAVTEDGKNLMIVGGSQALDLKALGMGEFSDKESVIVGSIKTLDYFATKDWKDGKKPETAVYTHKLNEETGGPLPMLRYDTRNRKCFIDGGLYHIKRPLLGGTSPGLEN